MKKIAILGSTGSIGTQTLEVVRENKDIEVLGLAAGKNIGLAGTTDPGVSSGVCCCMERRQSRRT